MKKFMKKNNKGFSLVELIVVVLIIAIIAVALAPQVTKWVKSAQENTEKNNIATLTSTVQTVTTDAIAAGNKIPANEFTVKADDVTLDTADASDCADFKDLLETALANFTDETTYKVTINGTTYKVTVTK